jgi:quinol monooxygenase YgiN
MPKAVWYISYKLIEGANVKDFLLASKKCHDDSMSKNKGFISWDVLRDGDTWVDVVTFETMEDAENAEGDGNETTTHPSALAFYAFIDPDTLKHASYIVEKIH